MKLWKCPECGHVNAARHKRELPNECGTCGANLGSGKPGVWPNWDRVREVSTT